MKKWIQNLLRKGRKGGVFRKFLAWYLLQTRPLIFYHGTSDVHLDSLERGIQPQTGINFEGLSQFGEGFYTTTNKTAAQFFAENAVDIWGGNPIIVRFKIPRRLYRRLKGYEVTGSAYQRYSWRIPEHFITDYDYLRGLISGFEELGWSQIKFNPRAYRILNRYLDIPVSNPTEGKRS